MSRENNYVPISEIDQSADEPAIWRVNLPPYVSADEIGINLKRLNLLTTLSGFESLRISSYDGEVTATTPNIESIGQDGSVTASTAAVVTIAETQKSLIRGQLPGAPRILETTDEYNWTRGAVTLNTTELDVRIGEKGAVRDPKLWSEELNRALGKGIRGAVRKNLVERPALSSKLIGPSAVTALTVAAALADKNFSAAEILSKGAEFSAGWSMIYDPLFNMFMRHLPLQERRWSFVPGMQLDRIVAVNALTRISPLVKQLKPQAESTQLTV